MPTCFVIQPFDDKFNKRFEDTYRPALEQAGLDAYRVDQDPGVVVPIETIEEGIRDASICLADITMDNPNVWYELGYAFAAGCPVIMVCDNDRNGRLPFDIQHRAVIKYNSHSSSDFDSLRQKITEKAEALLQRNAVGHGAGTRPISLHRNAAKHGAGTGFMPPARDSESLGQDELRVLSCIVSDAGVPGNSADLSKVQQDVENTGLTKVRVSVAMSRLKQKSFVEFRWHSDGFGNEFQEVTLSDDGWNWVAENGSSLSDEDDIPF